MISGGCFCGAVSYEIDGELCKARACHCSKCRKVFGGTGSAYAEVVESSSFRWASGEGELSRYSSAAEWSIAFCSVCGSTLAGLHHDDVHGVTLGSVNGDPGVEIEMHLFVDSKASWDHIGGPAPQHEEFPPDWGQ